MSSVASSGVARSLARAARFRDVRRAGPDEVDAALGASAAARGEDEDAWWSDAPESTARAWAEGATDGSFARWRARADRGGPGRDAVARGLVRTARDADADALADAYRRGDARTRRALLGASLAGTGGSAVAAASLRRVAWSGGRDAPRARSIAADACRAACWSRPVFARRLLSEQWEAAAEFARRDVARPESLDRLVDWCVDLVEGETTLLAAVEDEELIDSCAFVRTMTERVLPRLSRADGVETLCERFASYLSVLRRRRPRRPLALSDEGAFRSCVAALSAPVGRGADAWVRAWVLLLDAADVSTRGRRYAWAVGCVSSACPDPRRAARARTLRRLVERTTPDLFDDDDDDDDPPLPDVAAVDPRVAASAPPSVRAAFLSRAAARCAASIDEESLAASDAAWSAWPSSVARWLPIAAARLRRAVDPAAAVELTRRSAAAASRDPRCARRAWAAAHRSPDVAVVVRTYPLLDRSLSARVARELTARFRDPDPGIRRAVALAVAELCAADEMAAEDAVGILQANMEERDDPLLAGLALRGLRGLLAHGALDYDVSFVVLTRTWGWSGADASSRREEVERADVFVLEELARTLGEGGDDDGTRRDRELVSRQQRESVDLLLTIGEAVIADDDDEEDEEDEEEGDDVSNSVLSSACASLARYSPRALGLLPEDGQEEDEEEEERIRLRRVALSDLVAAALRRRLFDDGVAALARRLIVAERDALGAAALWKRTTTTERRRRRRRGNPRCKPDSSASLSDARPSLASVDRLRAAEPTWATAAAAALARGGSSGNDDDDPASWRELLADAWEGVATASDPGAAFPVAVGACLAVARRWYRAAVVDADDDVDRDERVRAALSSLSSSDADGATRLLAAAAALVAADDPRVDDVGTAARSALDVARGDDDDDDLRATTLGLTGAYHALTRDWRVVDDVVERLSDALGQGGEGRLSTASSFWGAHVGLGVVAQYLGRTLRDAPSDVEAAVRVRRVVGLLFRELSRCLAVESRALRRFVAALERGEEGAVDHVEKEIVASAEAEEWEVRDRDRAFRFRAVGVAAALGAPALRHVDASTTRTALALLVRARAWTALPPMVAAARASNDPRAAVETAVRTAREAAARGDDDDALVVSARLDGGRAFPDAASSAGNRRAGPVSASLARACRTPWSGDAPFAGPPRWRAGVDADDRRALTRALTAIHDDPNETERRRDASVLALGALAGTEPEEEEDDDDDEEKEEDSPKARHHRDNDENAPFVPRAREGTLLERALSSLRHDDDRTWSALRCLRDAEFPGRFAATVEDRCRRSDDPVVRGDCLDFLVGQVVDRRRGLDADRRYVDAVVRASSDGAVDDAPRRVAALAAIATRAPVGVVPDALSAVWRDLLGSARVDGDAAAATLRALAAVAAGDVRDDAGRVVPAGTRAAARDAIAATTTDPIPRAAADARAAASALLPAVDLDLLAVHRDDDPVATTLRRARAVVVAVRDDPERRARELRRARSRVGRLSSSANDDDDSLLWTTRELARDSDDATSPAAAAEYVWDALDVLEVEGIGAAWLELLAFRVASWWADRVARNDDDDDDDALETLDRAAVSSRCSELWSSVDDVPDLRGTANDALRDAPSRLAFLCVEWGVGNRLLHRASRVLDRFGTKEPNDDDDDDDRWDVLREIVSCLDREEDDDDGDDGTSRRRR